MGATITKELEGRDFEHKDLEVPKISKVENELDPKDLTTGKEMDPDKKDIHF